MTKRIFIVTGEPSGDIHASFVVKELNKLIDDLEIEAVGSIALKNAGVKLFANHSDMAVVGLSCISKIPYHFKLGVNILKHLKEEFKPDLVLLIDYGGFNLRLARELKKHNIKVFYYISPQIWGSRKNRLKIIAKYIDKMMLILPFEEAIHKKAGVNAEFVGHPLVSQLPPKITKYQLCQKHKLNNNQPIVGLLPGSRKIEIHFLLENFLRTSLIIKQSLPETQFCLAQSANISDDLINKYIKKADPENLLNIKILKNANHEIVSGSDLLILASGTVTLEATIYQTPMILSYKTFLTAYIIYLMIRYIDKLGLPNIISGKDIVPEFLQYNTNPINIANTAIYLLSNSEKRNKMLKELADVNKLLTNKVASARVAEIIKEELK